MKQYTRANCPNQLKWFLAGFIILALTGGSCPTNNDSSNNGGTDDDETAAASGSASVADTDAFVITTDFFTGSFSVIHLADRSVQQSLGSINSDAVAAFFDGSIYVVNRFGQDNIQLINSSSFATTGQFSTGNGSNPQDIALVSANEAYVSRLNETSLLRMNPATGDTLGTIDFAAHADTDGKPEMTALHLQDGKLYVALQRLDQNAFFSPTDHSEIVVINTTDNTIEKTLVTEALNPGTDFVFHEDLGLLIGETGFFGTNDGGIEAIDVTTGQSQGLIISEATLGGDIIAFDLLSKDKGYAVVAGGTVCDNTAGTCQTDATQLVSFNPTTGAKLATVFVGGAFTLVDVRFNSLGQAYLCDTTFTNPGVRVFDGTTDTQLTSSPIDTGLPPYKVVFFDK